MNVRKFPETGNTDWNPVVVNERKISEVQTHEL
jgi:hypothetical protein